MNTQRSMAKTQPKITPESISIYVMNNSTQPIHLSKEEKRRLRTKLYWKANKKRRQKNQKSSIYQGINYRSPLGGGTPQDPSVLHSV